jgi:single-stranded DNA-specific DHH superfamily exonuclease
LLITVDSGINARAAVHLTQRLGIDVVVIDHHRIQEQAETTAVWSDTFCGAGLAAMFAWALALRAGWNDAKVERLLSGCSQYAGSLRSPIACRLLASKCIERYAVPSIVLVPSTIPGQVVGSGRSVPGVDLFETLRPLEKLLLRFGGHAQAVGLTMAVDHIEEFREKFARSVEPLVRGHSQTLHAEAELNLSFIGRHFEEQLLLLEPFGEGNRPPTFSIRMAEVVSVRNKWVRIRQGRSSVEALCPDVPVTEQMKGGFPVEFYGKTRILRGFTPR